MDEALIKEEYWNSLKNHFGESIAEKVKSAMKLDPNVSIRKHLYKSSDIILHQNVAWCSNGFILENRPKFSLDPNFHGGCYYVQDSSSMILQEALKQLSFEHKDPIILDACAAPGGKSTIILDFLNGNGFLIANEIDGKRNDILEENLTKWGYANQAITRCETQFFESLVSFFDAVVVDAPCSGEGMFRKDHFAVSQWNNSLVQQCNLTQKKILTDLTPSIKPGGYLIYCTCTTNQIENEFQILSLIESGDFELANPNLDSFAHSIIPATQNDLLIGHYLLPGISTGEGQFISVLRKKSDQGDLNVPRKRRLQLCRNSVDTAEFGLTNEFDLFWQNGSQYYGATGAVHKLEELPDWFQFRSIGLSLIESEGKKRIPLHGLAMDYRSKKFIELNLTESLAYLRKETISAKNFETDGWHLVGFEKQALGWVKAIGNRVNNYYPNKYKLRLK